MNTRRAGGFALVGYFVLVFSVTPCWAMAGKDRMATEGQPVSAQSGWPEGVVEFLNLPQRTDGWRSWFSGTPSDVQSYGFRLSDLEEANQLLARFAEIRTDRLSVVFVMPVEGEERQRLSASLIFGDQDTINRWFKSLKVDGDGRRIYGRHRYAEPPEAMPPTLVLTLPRAADAQELKVPAQIQVKRRPQRQRIGHEGITLF